MKQIMSLMLGLSLLGGTAAMFAQAPTDTSSTKTTKTKKSKRTKKTDTSTTK